LLYYWQFTNILLTTITFQEQNGVSGSIPSEIAMLPSLQMISLYNNSIVGQLPRNIGKLSHLQELDLEQNNLHGPLFFDELFELADTLKTLRVSNNAFTGIIPNEIGNFTKLKELWLASTDLTGSIPLGMGSLKELGMEETHILTYSIT
jgi:Leucine-rich repeat (LRR) protein